jgi:hypothetical protein
VAPSEMSPGIRQKEEEEEEEERLYMQLETQEEEEERLYLQLETRSGRRSGRANERTSCFFQRFLNRKTCLGKPVPWAGGK